MGELLLGASGILILLLLLSLGLKVILMIVGLVIRQNETKVHGTTTRAELLAVSRNYAMIRKTNIVMTIICIVLTALTLAAFGTCTAALMNELPAG